MKTRAVRIYGKDDLRLEEFKLPPIKEDEIVARVVSDSLCMSSYKAARQGASHKRVPDDVARNPTIIGHEFCGEIIEVGRKWQDKFKPGGKFAIQPALNQQGSLDAVGYSYRFIGGDATYVIIPREVIDCGCLLDYEGEGYFPASLAEPISCIIAAFRANYHTSPGSYVHKMGTVEGGNLAILGGAGPMGLGAIDYVLHCDRKPGLVVVSDIDDDRLRRAETFFTPDAAWKKGVKLTFVNPANLKDPQKQLLSLTGGRGYDDVFVFAPVKSVIETGDKILRQDGCLNFFAGPMDQNFSAELNFYNVHYAFTHIVATSGGNADDMKESLEMITRGMLNPAVMITHIGGLDSVIETTLNLPGIPGGKKLIYTNKKLELTAIDDFKKKGKGSPLFKELAGITERHHGLWSVEAEKYLLKKGEPIS